MRDAAGVASDLRRRLSFLEAVLRDLTPAQDEAQALGRVGQLALRHLASACWIFLRDDRGTLRLAHASQAANAPPPPPPAGLTERVQVMLGRRGRKPGRADQKSAVVIPLEHAGARLGALAVLPGRGPGTALQWMSQVLAAQGAAAIARARSLAGLRHAVALRDDVFAAAAHELGNSLAALALQVRALLEEDQVRRPASPLLPRLGAMEVQIGRLIDLNRRMLDSSRLEGGKFILELETVDATEVLREVLARNAEELAWRRCPVEFPDPGPLPGTFDRGLLDQIFGNLLSNAMKYGHGRPITLSLQGSEGAVEFRIEDRGIGVAAADQRRIFEKFERAAPIEQGTSLGIGLWLVDRMTRALGGSVHLTSAPGAGSIFTVKLPRKAPARRTAREVSP